MLRALPDLCHLPLPVGFPHPDRFALRTAIQRLTEVPDGSTVLIDGLAFGALPVGCLQAIRAPVVALVHHPLYLETGLSAAVRDALFASERAALSHAAGVVATSHSTAALLTQVFDVPRHTMVVAEPGTDPVVRASRNGMPPHLLSVGAVVPRKGYDILVDALAGLRLLPWTLTIAGALDRDADAVKQLRTAVAAHGLTQRIRLAGTVAVLDSLYAGADLFVTASFHEGYGMAAATALSYGLPLVASTAGALATTVPDAAALKVPPGDRTSLQAALQRMLMDQTVRDACSDASWAAGQRLPTWQQTAAVIAAALDHARKSA